LRGPPPHIPDHEKRKENMDTDLSVILFMSRDCYHFHSKS
jgi:hypothetical protein